MTFHAMFDNIAVSSITQLLASCSVSFGFAIAVLLPLAGLLIHDFLLYLRLPPEIGRAHV